MKEDFYKEKFSLIRTNNGEYISSENAVFNSIDPILRAFARRHGLPLEMHKLSDGQKWYLKSEVDNARQEFKKYKTMDILKKLQEAVGNPKIKFPKGLQIRIGLKEFIIDISEDGLMANMQTDASAFESWAICLKAYLCKSDEGVCIAWKKPTTESDVYNRFLYRAIKFAECFDWVSIYSSDKDEIDSFRRKLEEEKVLLNYSTEKEVITMPDEIKSEHDLELCVVKGMREMYGQCVDHQLPVGLFFNKVSKDSRLATGGKSQIDIWRLNDNALYIYELKKDKNVAVGIISELLFYANVMKDLVEGKISYPDDFGNAGRSIDKLHDAVVAHSIDSVNAVFLANKLHPLITDKVLDLLNTNKRGIHFDSEETSKYKLDK